MNDDDGNNNIQPAEVELVESEPGKSEPGEAIAAFPQVYRFREMEELRKNGRAHVIHRLGDFRKAVMLVGAEWYEEKMDQKTGIVRYYLCSPERKEVILKLVARK